jgi:hypothetical protein
MALQALGWAVAATTAWQIGEHDVASCLPVIELGDGMPDDPLDGAQEVLWLRQAVAASTETLVRTLHPNWDDTQVANEVDQIVEDKLLTAGPDMPPGGRPAAQTQKPTTGKRDKKAGSGDEPNTSVA